MQTSPLKHSGTALLIGSLLMLATMMLHPTGGNLQHLIRISRVIIISHSLALLAIPFLGLGFLGLLRQMGSNRFLPLLSFFLVLTGLLAGMVAATINGLALPIYIRNYAESSDEIAASIRPILRNNIAINQAFDFVFLVALSMSVFFWSVSILQLKKLPVWIGYLGLLLSLSSIAMIIPGYVFVDLHGFRLFIFLNVLWIASIGLALLQSPRIAQSLVEQPSQPIQK